MLKSFFFFLPSFHIQTIISTECKLVENVRNNFSFYFVLVRCDLEQFLMNIEWRRTKLNQSLQKLPLCSSLGNKFEYNIFFAMLSSSFSNHKKSHYFLRFYHAIFHFSLSECQMRERIPENAFLHLSDKSLN